MPALEPDRLAHVSGTYLSAETFSLANAPLIDAQADIPFARALGGGLVAAIDGMRFVVPVPSVYARPNRKYFGPKRGVTWLNMINDQAAGLGGTVVAGTVRDSLHMIDVLFNQDGGQRPERVRPCSLFWAYQASMSIWRQDAKVLFRVEPAEEAGLHLQGLLSRRACPSDQLALELIDRAYRTLDRLRADGEGTASAVSRSRVSARVTASEF